MTFKCYKDPYRNFKAAAILQITGKAASVSDFSPLLQHAIEKGRGPILHSKKSPGPHGETNFKKIQLEAYEELCSQEMGIEKRLDAGINSLPHNTDF